MAAGGAQNCRPPGRSDMGLTYAAGTGDCEKCGSSDTHDLRRDDGAEVRVCNGCLSLKVLSGPAG